MDRIHRLAFIDGYAFLLYYSFIGDVMMVRQRFSLNKSQSQTDQKSDFLLFNLSKMFEKYTLQHVAINRSTLSIVTGEAKLFLIDLDSQEIYQKKPDYLTLMSKFEFEEVEIRRLTRPNSQPYFKICGDQGLLQKKTIHICSFYNGFQKLLITPFNRDLGLQIICQADITFEGILKDHFFHPVQRLENGNRVYKKE
jgi:hypothetical protein